MNVHRILCVKCGGDELDLYKEVGKAVHNQSFGKSGAVIICMGCSCAIWSNDGNNAILTGVVIVEGEQLA